MVDASPEAKQEHVALPPATAPDALAPARSWRERWLRALVEGQAAQRFPSAWRKTARSAGDAMLVEYAHSALVGWVTIAIAASSRSLRWGWRWSEPRWDPSPSLPRLPEERPQEAGSEAPSPSTARLLVQLGTPPPEPKAPAPFNHASKPAPLAPPAADTSRFHASAGPDWVFRVLERLIRSGVRLPRTIATKDVWTRINAPGGAIESFPIGWQVLEAYLPANGEDLLLGCGRHLPQGLLVLRVRFDGKLLAAEWRDANSVAPNLHDTPERRTQLEAFVRRLAIERGIPAEMPQFAGAEQDEPGRTPRPSPAEGPARSSSPRLLEPRAEAGRESESDSKSSPCKTRKSNLGGTAPESSGHTDPGLGINKDLEYNRRTQGDNWY